MQPPNPFIPPVPSGGMEKQTKGPVRQDFKGAFQSNQIEDSFGVPGPENRGDGLARALQGKPFVKCPSCGCSLASVAGMDNHSCAPMFDYYANTQKNVAEFPVQKRN